MKDRGVKAAVAPVEKPDFEANPGGQIVARRYDSGFEYSKGNYNGVACASDGSIYYVLCSGELHVGGQLYRYLPSTDSIEHLGDLTAACGEADLKAIPQGKSHVLFVEKDAELYFATHLDYYQKVTEGSGIERKAAAPEGYLPYPGGHMLSYNIETGEFTDHCLGVDGEGIITFAMDTRRMRMYGVTWPSGHVLRYDIPTRSRKVFGKYFADGEVGEGASYQMLTRVITVDPRDGAAYFGNIAGDFFRIDHGRDTVERITTDTLKGRSCLGGSGADMFRQAVYSPTDGKVYGKFVNSQYLATYDPGSGKFEFLDRLATDDVLRRGTTGPFGLSLGMMFGNDGETIFDLSVNSPEKVDVVYRTNGVTDRYPNWHYSDFHLISYNIRSRERRDYGRIVLEDGLVPNMVNSMAIGRDGTFYAVAYFDPTGERTLSDLIRFRPKVRGTRCETR